MGCYSIIDIYYISFRLIILSLTVRCSTLPNYQTYFEGIDPISSSVSTSSLPSPTLSSLSSSPSDVLSQQQEQQQEQQQPQHQQQQQQQQQDHQLSPEPGNMIEFENSYPIPVLRGTRNGSTSYPSSLTYSPMMFNRHPIHVIFERLIKAPETFEGSYQRGRRYRDKSDKSFIRFGRSPVPQQTFTLWPRENRKRPEKSSDTYFLRFGRSTK